MRSLFLRVERLRCVNAIDGVTAEVQDNHTIGQVKSSAAACCVKSMKFILSDTVIGLDFHAYAWYTRVPFSGQRTQRDFDDKRPMEQSTGKQKKNKMNLKSKSNFLFCENIFSICHIIAYKYMLYVIKNVNIINVDFVSSKTSVSV